jgi:hypothetical protein
MQTTPNKIIRPALVEVVRPYSPDKPIPVDRVVDKLIDRGFKLGVDARRKVRQVAEDCRNTKPPQMVCYLSGGGGLYYAATEEEAEPFFHEAESRAKSILAGVSNMRRALRKLNGQQSLGL